MYWDIMGVIKWKCTKSHQFWLFAETYGLISTYTFGVVESITLQIEDFITPDHTRANYAGLVLHGAHR